MSRQTTADGGAASAPRVSDSEVRLARALVESLERHHQVPEEWIRSIAALPVPEDERGAA